MRILMLTGYYEPEITACLYILSNLAEDIAEKGCRVDVLTPSPVRGIDDKTKRSYRRMKKEEKCHGNLVVHRAFVPFGEPVNVLLRALRYFLVTVVLFFKALSIKTDVLFVGNTPPTLGLAVILLKYLKSVPVAYMLQDIFPDSMINSGIVTNGPLIAIGRFMERLIYKNMDIIVTPSSDFTRNIIAKGVPQTKTRLIYNWTDEKAVFPVPRADNILFGRYDLSDEAFYITYCGNIGYTQNLELLIDTAKSLENYHDLQFVIIGDGAHKQALADYTKERDVKNVRFLPFQPYEEISHVFSLGDAGLVISKHNIGRNSFPVKTWSIMSAERPIVASFDTDSELCTLINNAECGICIPPEDFNSLRQAILELYHKRESVQVMGRNGRRFILENLNRHSGTDNWFKIFQHLVYRNQAKAPGT